MFSSTSQIDSVAAVIISSVVGVYLSELLFILPLLYGNGYESWEKNQHIFAGKLTAVVAVKPSIRMLILIGRVLIRPG